jgi:hypothetical protein
MQLTRLAQYMLFQYQAAYTFSTESSVSELLGING